MSPDLSCVEARGLALGLRMAWRLRLPADQIDTWRVAFSGGDTAMSVSPAGYATVQGGVLRRSRESGAVHLVVIAVDEATARACLDDEIANADRDEGDDPAAWAATIAAHRRAGRVYGYPDCCVAAFCDGWLEAMSTRQRVVSDNALLILRAHLRSQAWHPLLRAFGAGLGEETASPLRHLPCRFDCSPSLALAQAIVADLRLISPAQAGRYERAAVHPIRLDADGSLTPWHGALEPSMAPSSTGPTMDVASLFPVTLPFAD